VRGFLRIVSGLVGIAIIGAWVVLIGSLGGMSCGYVSGATCGLDWGALFERELVGGTILAGAIGSIFLALAIFGGRKGRNHGVG
jgi:hypothetical protein